MKTVYITIRPNSVEARNVVVQLNNHDENERLTPALVRAALRIAVGHDRVTADANDGTRYYHHTWGACRLVG